MSNSIDQSDCGYNPNYFTAKGLTSFITVEVKKI